MRRRLYWLGVLLAAGLLLSGVLVGGLGYAATAAPGSVVRDYFAALARGDAAAALGYGSLPRGPRLLLTARALAEQQRIAPIRRVTVTSTRQHGDHAKVGVRYHLAFRGADVPVSVDVPLHMSSGNWWLDRTAVGTELLTGGAWQRASLLGGTLPDGRALYFPGALPIRLDTPYLQLDPRRDMVSFGTQNSSDLILDVSPRGRQAMLAAVRADLRRCLTVGRDPACPLPTERYVPDSLHGRVVSGLSGGRVVLEPQNPAGLLHFTGTATVAGRWRRLDFHNRPVEGTGRIAVDVHAVGYATAPLRLHWTTG